MGDICGLDVVNTVSQFQHTRCDEIYSRWLVIFFIENHKHANKAGLDCNVL